jgi:hypothetical protein
MSAVPKMLYSVFSSKEWRASEGSLANYYDLWLPITLWLANIDRILIILMDLDSSLNLETGSPYHVAEHLNWSVSLLPLQSSQKEAEEEVRRLIKQLAPDFIYSASVDDTTCPCCFNGFVATSLEDLCAAICADLDVRGVGQRSIFLRILIPPMLDTARITVRTIVTRTNEKIIPFPTMAELTLRLLTHELVKARQLNIVSDVTVAEIQVR